MNWFKKIFGKEEIEVENPFERWASVMYTSAIYEDKNGKSSKIGEANIEIKLYLDKASKANGVMGWTVRRLG